MGIPFTPSMFAQVLVGGILSGGIYALIALGLTLIFGVMRVINVAHGEFVMLGAYTTYWAFTLLGMNPLLSLLLAMPLLFFLGAAIQKLLIARVVGGPEVTALLLTFGISIFIVNIATNVWTADFRSVPYLTASTVLGGVVFSIPRLLSFTLALAITLVVFLFLKISRIGKAIRATSQNRDMAMACGINVRRIDWITYGLGAALAAGGGSLISIMFAVYPEMGGFLTLKSFAVVILGGLGSYPGAFLGGLVLGVAEQIGSLFLAANVSEAIAYALMVFILLVKPSGLLGVVRQ